MTESCAACLDEGVEIQHHHLIPRSLGGERGPTAPLCANCHQLVHKVAKDLRLLDRIDDGGKRYRVAQMVSIILRAEAAVKKDPNRSVLVQDRLPAELSHKLSDLATLYGTSRKEAMRVALRMEHARWFGHSRGLREPHVRNTTRAG